MRAASQVKFTRCVLAAIISLLCVANAKASPVTYTESAIISGSLNGVSFTDKLLAITGTGDTAGISQDFPGHSPFLNFVTATFSVTAVGNGRFTDAIFVFDTSGAAGFTDETHLGDILDTLNAAFASYDLSTSIGPITGPSLHGTNPFLTTAGTLSITSAGDQRSRLL
jgi:hypothetical protein